MTIDLTDRLDPWETPLCPLCDQPIFIKGDAVMAHAHDTYFLVCRDCIEED